MNRLQTAPEDDAGSIAFPSARDWARWLSKNHGHSTGVWLRFFKKTGGTPSVSHAEALAIALCYGWIDGQLKGHDEESWLRKFTPRRPKSIWSKRNCELVEQLAAAGKMKAAGLEEMAAAKAEPRERPMLADAGAPLTRDNAMRRSRWNKPERTQLLALR